MNWKSNLKLLKQTKPRKTKKNTMIKKSDHKSNIADDEKLLIMLKIVLQMNLNEISFNCIRLLTEEITRTNEIYLKTNTKLLK